MLEWTIEKTQSQSRLRNFACFSMGALRGSCDSYSGGVFSGLVLLVVLALHESLSLPSTGEFLSSVWNHWISFTDFVPNSSSAHGTRSSALLSSDKGIWRDECFHFDGGASDSFFCLRRHHAKCLLLECSYCRCQTSRGPGRTYLQKGSPPCHRMLKIFA